jgi:fucose 4-O-acetylase-like acetyltransferase
MSNRYLWVDYAKGIGIILVVYGHVARGIFKAGIQFDPSTYNLVDSIIYTFHMPLFFFLAGLFFLQSNQKTNSINLIRIKAETILYPYVLWSLIQGGIEIILSKYTNGHIEISEVLALLWKPRAQFWFLYVLFFMFVLSTLLYRRSNLFWIRAVFVFSLLMYFIGANIYIAYLPNKLSQYFVFFTFGVLAASTMLKNNNPLPGRPIFLSVLFVMGQWVFHWVLKLRFDSNAPVEILLIGIISVAFVIVVSQKLCQLNLQWLAYLGQNSMIIYLMHILAGSGCRVVLQKILGVSDTAIHLAAGTVVGLIIPLLVFWLFNRVGFVALFKPPKLLRLGRAGVHS